MKCASLLDWESLINDWYLGLTVMWKTKILVHHWKHELVYVEFWERFWYYQIFVCV